MSIKQLCEDFAACDKIELGEDFDSAYDRCWELSLAFSWYCRGRGENTVMLRVEHPIKKITAQSSPGDIKLILHWVVEFLDHQQIVDWTARQFWEDAKHPMILDRNKLAFWWGIIG